MTSSEMESPAPKSKFRENKEFCELIVSQEGLDKKIMPPEFPNLEGAFVTLADDMTLKLWSLQPGTFIPQIPYPEPIDPRLGSKISPHSSPSSSPSNFGHHNISSSDQGKDGSSGDGCDSNEDSETASLSHSFGSGIPEKDVELTPTKRKLFGVSGIKKRMVRH